MKSIWKPGTRVRVREGVDELAGLTGTVEEVGYAAWMSATSVVIDQAPELGGWFADHELEEEHA